MSKERHSQRLTPEEIRQVLLDADLLHAPEAVEAALDQMAKAVTETFAHRDPLVLVVMIGGLFPAAKLLGRLNFPLQVDYVHATRYREDIRGSRLDWRVHPSGPFEDRSVLVIDDILDEGLTLAAILEYCRAEGAGEVQSAVLVEKRHDRKPAIQSADFTGLSVEDRYVFGCGMDYRGYLRNVPGIYAVRGL